MVNPLAAGSSFVLNPLAGLTGGADSSPAVVHIAEEELAEQDAAGANRRGKKRKAKKKHGEREQGSVMEMVDEEAEDDMSSASWMCWRKTNPCANSSAAAMSISRLKMCDVAR
eukprot:SAG31_NODE_4175_length_3507_cov_2.044894_2_plen_113_part_00